MAGVDVLERKGALETLAALARAHPKPFDAMDFAKAAGIDPKWAARLRAELVVLGLIEARVVRSQGAIKEYEITLTGVGRQVAQHVLAMEEMLARHAAREARGKR